MTRRVTVKGAGIDCCLVGSGARRRNATRSWEISTSSIMILIVAVIAFVMTTSIGVATLALKVVEVARGERATRLP